MSFVSDTFTGTTNTELHTYNAAWNEYTLATGGGIAGRIGVNAGTYAYATGGDSTFYYRTEAPASADYSVFIDLTAVFNDQAWGAGACGRMSLTQCTFYSVRHSQPVSGGGTGSTTLHKNVNSNVTSTTLGTYSNDIGTGVTKRWIT